MESKNTLLIENCKQYNKGILKIKRANRYENILYVLADPVKKRNYDVS